MPAQVDANEYQQDETRRILCIISIDMTLVVMTSKMGFGLKHLNQKADTTNEDIKTTWMNPNGCVLGTVDLPAAGATGRSVSTLGCQV